MWHNLPMIRKIQINPKTLVAGVMAVLFVLGVILLLQGLVDTPTFQARIVQAVKAQTGQTLTIKGKGSISLLPKPTFYLPGVELGGGLDEASPPDMSAEMMSINISVFSLFSSAPRITAVTLDHPVLSVERAHDNLIHWDWLNGTLLDAFASGENNEPVAVVINDGKIIYHNSQTDGGLAIENIHVYGVSGLAPQLDGTFSVYGHNLSIKSTVDAVANKEDRPIHLTLSSDSKNKIQVDGTLNLASDAPRINGDISMELEDLLVWMKPKTTETHTLLDRLSSSSNNTQEKKVTLPVKFSSNLSESGLSVVLSNAKLEGLNSVGQGRIGFSWADVLTIDTDMAFTSMDYNTWKLLATTGFQYKSDQTVGGGIQDNDASQDNILPKDIRVTLNFSANQLIISSQTWENALVRMHLDAGTVTVNQFHVTFPGESDLSLFGIVSQGNGKGVRFEGSMETQGKSLRKFLTIFDESASDLPDAIFGSFYAHSNIFISSEQLRLSEADVRINELRLNGGLVAYYDPAPHLEADVKLKNINFDYFRDVSRKEQESSGHKEFLLKFDKSANFSWLKKLQTTVDLKVNVDHFTFLEREGENASFRLFAREGEFGIYDIRFYYPHDTMEASFRLAFKDNQPYVNALVNANQIDMNYFNASPQPEPNPAPDERKKWSEDLIDMGWMDGLNGTFDVSIGKLLYGDKSIDNLKMKSTLQDNLLTFQSLSFLYWQGKCDMAGSIYGGKVPGVSLGFTLYDAEIHDVLKAWADRDNISGRISLSGSVVTSGVNPLSWISQADAKVVLTARGVTVQSFNLQGVTDAVAVSRTASDVLNNVNLAMRDGTTEMSVDGNVNVKNGVVRTPGITLKAGTITGNLTGEVKLVPWTMDVTTLYQFPAMKSETLPTMTVQLEGSADKPELQVDTSSLEAYVAKRITGR